MIFISYRLSLIAVRVGDQPTTKPISVSSKIHSAISRPMHCCTRNFHMIRLLCSLGVRFGLAPAFIHLFPISARNALRAGGLRSLRRWSLCPLEQCRTRAPPQAPALPGAGPSACVACFAAVDPHSALRLDCDYCARSMLLCSMHRNALDQTVVSEAGEQRVVQCPDCHDKAAGETSALASLQLVLHLSASVPVFQRPIQSCL